MKDEKLTIFYSFVWNYSIMFVVCVFCITKWHKICFAVNERKVNAISHFCFLSQLAYDSEILSTFVTSKYKLTSKQQILNKKIINI